MLVLFLGETEKTMATLPTVFRPEIDQVKFPLQPNNQVAFPVNPLQSYIENQPYLNRFTGKDMKVLSNQWRASALVPSFVSRQGNTIHQYITSSDVWGHRARNRFGLTSNGQMENRPQPRQLRNQKIIPSASGVILFSLIKNIPILKSYNGGNFVISRSNLYLLNKLFPFATPHAARPNTYKWQLNKPTTFRYPNGAFCFTNKTDSATDTLKPGVQANPVANVGGLYQNQNIIGTQFPNGYLNIGDAPANSVKQSYNHIVMGKASYLKPHVKPLALANSFQTIRGSNSRPIMSAGYLANNPGFQSQLNKGFHIRHSFPWRKRLGPVSNAGKVVTEGELREKGLLSDILSRNHINNNKGGKVSK